MKTTSKTKMTKEVVEIAPEILVLEKKVTKQFFWRALSWEVREVPSSNEPFKLDCNLSDT